MQRTRLIPVAILLFWVVIIVIVLAVFLEDVQILTNNQPRDFSVYDYATAKNISLYPPYDKKILKGAPISTLCFSVGELSERGTNVALYDYADYTETILHKKSIIFFHGSPALATSNVFKKFQNRFKTVQYESGNHFLLQLVKEKCDFLYVIKSGEKNSYPVMSDFTPEVVPVGFHAVFTWEPHGSSYAAISEDVVQYSSLPVVPHIVRPVDTNAYQNAKDLRKELNIPQSAFVLCRHGGMETFDIDWVFQTVWKTVAKYSPQELHYIFMNTWRFYPNGTANRNDLKLGRGFRLDVHPQIHHIAPIVDLVEKENFFKTCNAMLHARTPGETFGLAIAEFSVHNLPVITYANAHAKQHLHILKDKGFLYQGSKDLEEFIDSFVKRGVPAKNYNAYEIYHPEKVMPLFEKNFLDPIYK
jgi:hypothetical protein